MDDNQQKTWISEIQDEASRLTKKRLAEDKAERDRLQAEENKALASDQADNKKKA